MNQQFEKPTRVVTPVGQSSVYEAGGSSSGAAAPKVQQVPQITQEMVNRVKQMYAQQNAQTTKSSQPESRPISPVSQQQMVLFLYHKKLQMAHQQQQQQQRMHTQRHTADEKQHQQQSDTYYQNLMADLLKSQKERRAHRTALFNETELAEKQDLEVGVHTEEAARISVESTLDYYGPLAQRRNRGGARACIATATMSTSKRAKLKKQQLQNIIRSVTSEELYEKRTDALVASGGMSLALRREMMAGAKREMEKMELSKRERKLREEQQKAQSERMLMNLNKQMLSLNYIHQQELLKIQNVQLLYYELLRLQEHIMKHKNPTKEQMVRIEYLRLNIKAIINAQPAIRQVFFSNALHECEKHFKQLGARLSSQMPPAPEEPPKRVIERVNQRVIE